MTNGASQNMFGELMKIQSWPSVGLVFAVVIVVGYCLRMSKRFPFNAIPIAVVLSGMVSMMLISEDHPANVVARVWHVKLAFTGLIIGFIAWLTHNAIVSKFEDYLAARFPLVDRTINKNKPKVNLPQQHPPTHPHTLP